MAHCDWCDERWETSGARRPSCPRCGRPDWDKEADYRSLGVTEWREYEILAETSDFHRVFWLDIQDTLMARINIRAPLSHRLKNTYRKQMDDMRSKDARGLIVIFSKPRGPDGEWEISVTRPRRPPHNPFLEPAP